MAGLISMDVALSAQKNKRLLFLSFSFDVMWCFLFFCWFISLLCHYETTGKLLALELTSKKIEGGMDTKFISESSHLYVHQPNTYVDVNFMHTNLHIRTSLLVISMNVCACSFIYSYVRTHT